MEGYAKHGIPGAHNSDTKIKVRWTKSLGAYKLWAQRMVRRPKVARHGCILSPYLFNLYTEMIMRSALNGYGGDVTVDGKVVTNLRYADDVVLIASTLPKLHDTKYTRYKKKNGNRETGYNIANQHMERSAPSSQNKEKIAILIGVFNRWVWS